MRCPNQCCCLPKGEPSHVGPTCCSATSVSPSCSRPLCTPEPPCTEPYTQSLYAQPYIQSPRPQSQLPCTQPYTQSPCTQPFTQSPCTQPYTQPLIDPPGSAPCTAASSESQPCAVEANKPQLNITGPERPLTHCAVPVDPGPYSSVPVNSEPYTSVLDSNRVHVGLGASGGTRLLDNDDIDSGDVNLNDAVNLNPELCEDAVNLPEKHDVRTAIKRAEVKCVSGDETSPEKVQVYGITADDKHTFGNAHTHQVDDILPSQLNTNLTTNCFSGNLPLSSIFDSPIHNEIISPLSSPQLLSKFSVPIITTRAHNHHTSSPPISNSIDLRQTTLSTATSLPGSIEAFLCVPAQGNNENRTDTSRTHTPSTPPTSDLE